MRSTFHSNMSPNNTSKFLRANEVESSGSVPEGDGEQTSLYWISASQTVPASQSFFLLPSPKMALNAGAWRDLRDHQVCGSQTLACAKGCVTTTPGALAQQNRRSSRQRFWLKGQGPGGWAFCLFVEFPTWLLCSASPPHLTRTSSFYRWGTRDSERDIIVL